MINGIQYEYIIVTTSLILCITLFVSALFLIIKVSKFGAKSETYLNMGETLLLISMFMLIIFVMMYVFYPSFVAEMLRDLNPFR